MDAIIYKRQVIRDGETVFQEYRRVDPRFAHIQGNFRVRQVSQYFFQGQFRRQVSDRALDMDEELALMELLQDRQLHRAAEKTRQLQQERNEKYWSQVYLRELKRQYFAAYDNYHRCPNLLCRHGICHEPPISRSHPYSNLSIRIAPEVYEDLTGLRPYQCYFDSYRDDFRGFEGQSFLSQPGKQDPGYLDPYYVRRRDAKDRDHARKRREREAAAKQAELQKRRVWDSEYFINVSNDNDWEAKAVERAEQERAQVIEGIRRRDQRAK